MSFPNAPCPPELSGGIASSAAHAAGPPGTPGGYSPPFCDISGQWLPGISRTALSYGAEYNHPIGSAAGTASLFIAFDGSYRSKFSSNPSRSTYTDIGSYAMVGQTIQARHSEIRADHDLEVNAKAEAEIEVILQHLEYQTRMLVAMLDKRDARTVAP